MTKKLVNVGREQLVALLCVALTATLLMLLPGSAVASSPIVDPNEKGSLSIYKFDGLYGTPHDGEELGTLPTNTPLANAEFTIYPINGLDLSKNSDWTRLDSFIAGLPYGPSLSAVTAALVPAGLTMGASQTGTTQMNGAGTAATVVFDNLPVGLYYVAETKAPSGYRAVRPFLVTVPLSSADGSTWNYDVHVYPKDAIGGSKKLITSGPTPIGTPLEWQIDVIIPALDLAKGESLPHFIIRDWLDAKLEYNHATQPARVELVVAGASQPGVLVENVHFTVDKSLTGDYLDVVFTTTGLRLLEQYPGEVVSVVVPTIRKSFGQIANRATLYSEASDKPYGRAGEGGINIEGSSVRYSWVTVFKHGVGAESAKPLVGAKFAIYSASVDDFAKAVQTSDAESTLASGELTFSEPQRNSDYFDHRPITPGQAGYLYYWLVETEAPAGYMKLADPIPFQITAATSGGLRYHVYLDAGNSKINAGIELPFTGGSGTVLFVTVGSFLVAAAVALAVVYSRRRHAANQV